MALDHRVTPAQLARQPAFQPIFHTAPSSTTPRTTPSIQPQLYIKTEHRPSVHRADSYSHQLQRERTFSLPDNLGSGSSIETQHLVVEEEDEDDEGDEEDLSSDDEVDFNKEEDASEYCFGGYHPVELGERFGANNQYRIVRKLGWGHFSTVWLAFDEVMDRHVAIKVVRSRSNYTQAAMDEIKILATAGDADPTHPGYNHLVKMYEWFFHEGPNGKHVCMVFEVLGQTTLGLIDDCKKSNKEKKKSTTHEEVVSLLTLEKSYGGLPLSITKKIAKQLLLALDYLHRCCGLIHTDIKPENVLIEIKDVEKFVRCLKCSSATDRRLRRSSGSTGSTSSNSSRSRSARSRRHKSSTLTDSPVKCSKPLPSPLTTSSKLDFKDYFSSNYSLTSPSTSTSAPTHDRQSRSQGSVSYYEDPRSRKDSLSSSISPSLQHQTSNLSTFVVSASEADSDDEDSPSYLNSSYTTQGSTTTSPNIMSHLHSRLSSISIDDEDISSLINIKLADLGNACFYDLHYTNDIQTRQYRSPEILIGHRWGCSTDMWSTACVIFELMTGDYLFDPKSGKHHSKDDDHIAQIIELLEIRKGQKAQFGQFVRESQYGSEFFHSDCFSMRKIDKMKYWGLADVLQQKYKMEKQLACEIAEFLLPMLAFDPKERVDAGGWSNHPWLSDVKGCENVDREAGTCGEDIKGWYKTYRRSSN